MLIWKYILVSFYTLRRKLTYMWLDEYTQAPLPYPRHGLVNINGEYYKATTNKGWILLFELNDDGTYNYNKLTHEFRDDGY